MSTVTIQPLPTFREVARARQIGRRFYAPELDVLRFAAFMLVYLRHVVTSLGDAHRMATARPAAGTVPAMHTSIAMATAPSTGMWIRLQEALQCMDFGVCLFFFLSAFLITRLLLLERERSGSVSIRNFYMRRCLRIWPLYFTFLLAIVLLAKFVPTLEVTRGRLMAAVLFVSNWAAVLHGWKSIAIQPLWSVSVEEQFYGVWPWVARFGRTAILWFSGVLMLVAVATLIWVGRHAGTEVTTLWPNTLVQSLFLGGGALTACLSRPENAWRKDSTRLLHLALGMSLWIAASAGFHVVRTASPGPFSLVAGYILVLAGTYLIFTAVAGWDRWELPRPLIHVGRMSYGLYVFHVSVLLVLYDIVERIYPSGHGSPYLRVIAVSIAGLLLTMCLAALSYRFLESPFLQLKERFARVVSRPV